MTRPGSGVAERWRAAMAAAVETTALAGETAAGARLEFGLLLAQRRIAPPR